MKTLVTGSTGFIGNYVIRELLKNNCQVIATGRRVAEEVPYNWIEKVDYFPADLQVKQDNWFEFFDKPDCLFERTPLSIPAQSRNKDNSLYTGKYLGCDRRYKKRFSDLWKMVWDRIK